MKLTKKTKGNRKTMKLLAEFLQENFGKENRDFFYSQRIYGLC